MILCAANFLSLYERLLWPVLAGRGTSAASLVLDTWHRIFSRDPHILLAVESVAPGLTDVVRQMFDITSARVFGNTEVPWSTAALE
jgi:hypothetical protein